MVLDKLTFNIVMQIPLGLTHVFVRDPDLKSYVGGSRFYQLTQKTTFLPSDQPNSTACEPFVPFEIDR